MAVKYVFVTGGVVSGLGKGITAASLGRLLKARGYRVTMQKFDPYLNMDPGTMNPIQHGEVYVTDDGTETDLDLGHYERFIDESLNANSNVTTGKVYWTVLQAERHGDFGGGTVQVIPHITNEIKARFHREGDGIAPGTNGIVSRKDDTPPQTPTGDTEIAIIEVGGTVGDIEGQPFIEAIRQFQREQGPGNVCLVHVTLIPYLKASGEMKTKPTQMSVKTLQGMGLQPNVIVCRSDYPLDESLKQKISLFCNIPVSHVIENLDVGILYELPMVLEREHFAEVVLEELGLPAPEPNLADWEQMLENAEHPEREVTIELVGKYIQLHDAYLSVAEALRHGGFAERTRVRIDWIDAEAVTAETAEALLGQADGILVPGGFGGRGIPGKIEAIRYAREHGIPFLGLCLGMQCAIIEFARNVLGWSDADSTELDPGCGHPVIALMPEQEGVTDLGGTLRLGAYPCVLAEGTKARELYGAEQISERHRHRYEVNNDYRTELTAAGLVLSGQSPDGRIIEMIELPGHPFFVATQAHPEFKSRPNRPHPLFRGFVAAALAFRE